MIVLDVDGVLANLAGAQTVLGRSYDDQPASWWADIPPYPWAVELFTRLTALDRVLVATALNPRLHSAYAGRAEWIARHLKTTDFLIGPPKVALAQPGRVLVDDSRQTCASWRLKGGGAVEFPRSWHGEQVDVGDIVRQVGQLPRS